MAEETQQPSSDVPSVPIASVQQGIWLWANRRKGQVIAYFIIALLIEVLGVMTLIDSAGGNVSFMTEVMMGIPFIMILIAYVTVQGIVQAEFMRQFAAANGYTFAPKRGLEGLNGAFFNIGHDPGATDDVAGNYQGYPLELFLYHYTVGYGKNAHTYQYSIFKLRFDTEMPDVVLESGGHHFGESLLTTAAKQKEFVSLEGDFNKYFTLSIPKGYEVEALEVFTPDVMANLMEKCRSLSLEIVGANLFIYSPGVVSTEEGLLGLYGTAQYFAQELGPVLARMKPALAAEESVMGGSA